MGTMHKRALLSLLLLPSGLIACSALLGDFTVGTSDAGDGGGGDGSGDVVSDVPSDAPTLFKLSCVEGANQRIQVTKNLSIHPQHMRMASMANGLVRIVVTDQPPPQDGGQQSPPLVLHAYTIDPHNTGTVNDTPLQTNGFNVFEIIRYSGPKPGFAVLFSVYDQNTQTSSLAAVRLPDDASNWTTPVELTKLPSGNQGNESAAFTVVDPVNEVYYVALTTNDGTTQTIASAQVAGNQDGGVLPTVKTYTDVQSGRNVYEFVEPMISIRGGQPFLMLQPSGNNGPPPQGTPAVLLAPGKPDIVLQPPSNLNYFPVGFTDAVDPQKVNAAFLIADLNALQGSYNVGQVAASGLATLDPQKLPATVPPTSDGGSFSLADLFVNGQADHWEIAGPGEQFLMSAPTADPLTQTVYGGINFGWWDGPTGTLRSYAAGSSRLIKDVQYIGNTDTTFILLVGSIATMWVAYTSYPTQPTQNYPPPPAELWIAQIGCQKQ